jgi:hypothetical protein
MRKGKAIIIIKNGGESMSVNEKIAAEMTVALMQKLSREKKLSFRDIEKYYSSDLSSFYNEMLVILESKKSLSFIQ